MKLVKRYDYESSANAQTEMTPEGFLKVMARATRTGILKYRKADGTIVRELRHPDEVFKVESMATLAMKPFTNSHPTTLLDSETASFHQVGMTGEKIEVEDNKFLRVMTVITDRDTIADYKAGKVEVSPGYVCELDFTPGIFDGEEYDAIQKNIRYNHLALVNKGRSGPRVRLDSEDAVQVEFNQTRGKKTMQIKLDGKNFDVEDEVGAAIKKQIRKDAADKEQEEEEEDEKEKMKKDAAKDLEKANKAKEQAEAKADGLEAEIKKLKETKKDSVDPAVIRAAAKVRVALETVAVKAGVEKFDEMEDQDLKKAVIVAHNPEAKLDGKSEDYINARFDMASESLANADASANALGKAVVKKAGTTEVMDSDDARQKMIERNRTLCKIGS